MFAVGLTAGLGALAGAGVETHTDHVAREKIISAEGCFEDYQINGDATVPFGNIDDDVFGCMRNGSRGTKIGETGLSTQSYVTNYHNYIERQQNEADHFDLQNLAKFVGGFAVIGFALFGAGTLDGRYE